MFVFSWGIVIYDKDKKESHIHVSRSFRGKWDKSDAKKLLAVLPKPVTAPVNKHNKLAQNLVLNIGFKFLEDNETHNIYIKE